VVPVGDNRFLVSQKIGVHASSAHPTGIRLELGPLDSILLSPRCNLTPIVSIMGRELLEGDYIQADGTPVGVQMQDGRGKNRQAYLW
jgi:hypothetical protein